MLTCPGQNSNLRTVIKKFLFSLIAIAIGPGLAEMAARIVEPDYNGDQDVGDRAGWQTTFFGSLFDWHEPDPDLLWRFRANLNTGSVTTNDDHLIGEPVSRAKPANTFRILLLGDSSPVGLGLSSYRQSFGELLEGLLSDDFKRPVEVINAAVAGYSSEQIRRYLDLRGWAYDPDLVLLYCGNNDASVSGYLSDRELMERQHFKTLRRVAAMSALYRLMRSLAPSVGQPAADNQALVVRVTPEEYGQNLKEIATQCVTRSCPLVIVRPAVPLLWPAGLQFKVFQTVTGADGSLILPEPMRQALGKRMKYCFDWDEIAERYGEGDPFTRAVYRSAFADSLEPLEAMRHYAAQVTADPDDAVAANNLGVSYFDNGDYGLAQQWIANGRQGFIRQTLTGHDLTTATTRSVFMYNQAIARLSAAISATDSAGSLSLLDSALQLDYFSLRMKRSYAERIRAVADSLGPGVFVLDATAALAAGDHRRLAIERMFIDHCHPTARGHYRLAQALRSLITEQIVEPK